MLLKHLYFREGMRVTNNAMCFEANHPYISLTLNKTMGSHQSACWACIGKMRSLSI